MVTMERVCENCTSFSTLTLILNEGKCAEYECIVSAKRKACGWFCRKTESEELNKNVY